MPTWRQVLTVSSEDVGISLVEPQRRIPCPPFVDTLPVSLVGPEMVPWEGSGAAMSSSGLMLKHHIDARELAACWSRSGNDSQNLTSLQHRSADTGEASQARVKLDEVRLAAFAENGARCCITACDSSKYVCMRLIEVLLGNRKPFRGDHLSTS